MQKTKLFSLIGKLLSHNFRTLFLFELFYKLFAYGLLTPLLIWLMEVSIRLSGLHYLSGATVKKWMASPYTWLILLLVIILLCCYVLIDMTAVIICVDCAKRKEYVSCYTLLWESLKCVGRMFHWKNMAMLIYLLSLIPLLCLPFLTGYTTSVQTPAFIGNAVQGFFQKYWFMIVFLILLLAVIFRYIYAVFYYVLEKKNFLKACERSHYLIYHVYFKDLLKLFLWQITCYLVYSMIIALAILVIIGISSLFQEMEFIHAVMISIIQGMMGAVHVLFSCLVVPISTLFLCLLFYQNKEAIGEPIEENKYKAQLEGISRKKRNLIMLAAVLVLIILNINNIHHLADGTLSHSMEIAYVTEVTAHRGDSAEHPENTMVAFESAIDSGTDWIELDVQQTADGQIIVMHDSNLLRTTGVDRNIWEVTYDEIKDLDAGSYMGEEFSDVRISTLPEVLEACRGRVKLNIELKPNGHETDLVRQVVDIINEYDFAEDCVLASMSYGTLVDVKEYDSNIYTVLVMGTAYGYFADLNYVDAFSIKNTYITQAIVQSIHLQGKKVYAWTVNSEKTMERMVGMGVDNLITDQPLRARKKVFEMENSTIINQYIHMLTSLFDWN